MLVCPASMRAIEVTRLGGPEVLRLIQKPIPTLGAGEVLIQIHAAGVNRADLGQRSGEYPAQGGTMPLLGLEVSGKVIKVAADVTTWSPGDTVCALVTGGGYAEYISVPAMHCLPIPQGISMLEAACIPEVSMTVWSNIFAETPPLPGQYFLVHGGLSGVGSFALQLGSALGLRVLTTVGSNAKCRAALALGAELAINYRTQDFEDIIRQYASPSGVHAILDMVGGEYTPKNIRLLALDGKLAQIAYMNGPEVIVNLMEIMLKRARISGSLLKMRTPQEKANIIADLVHHVWPLYASGHLRVPIHQVFPLESAADAHHTMEKGGHSGKLVISVTPA